MFSFFKNRNKIPTRLSFNKDDNSPKIIGFYTKDTLYEREAYRLYRSAIKKNLAISLEAIDDMGSWLQNTSFKATFLLEERRKQRGPLLYVDADAVIHRDPWSILLQDYNKCDLALYYDKSQNELLSGTILLNDTLQCENVLAQWQCLCLDNPDIWDQKVLQSLLESELKEGCKEISLGRLPIEFCWIFDTIEYELTQESVYIEHLQASREKSCRKGLLGYPGKRLRKRRRRVRKIEKTLF